MIVGDNGNSIGNLGLANAVNIRLHQGAANLLALVVRQYSQGVNGNSAAAFFVTNSLSVFKSPALALPIGGQLHRSIRHAGLRGPGGNDLPNKCCGRLGLGLACFVPLDDGQGEESQAEFGTSGQAVDELW